MTLTSPQWISDLPPLGFGCCPMGGHGWGRVDEQELIQAVATALDLGVRLFDTSDIYGLGASETLLGRTLRGRRDEAVIATKFGVRYQRDHSYYDTSIGWIKSAIEGSLHRLGVDTIDLYQMHNWDHKTPLDDIVALLESFVAAGKIRAYGFTNHNPFDPAFRTHATAPATFSFHYSLVHREYESIIFNAQRQDGLVFLSWGSLGQGVLSGKYDSLSQLEPNDRRQREVYHNFHGEKFVCVQHILAEMRAIAREAGIPSLTQLALRWIIEHIPRAKPLVGIKRPAQIIDAAGVLEIRLEPRTCARLDALTHQFIDLHESE